MGCCRVVVELELEWWNKVCTHTPNYQVQQIKKQEEQQHHSSVISIFTKK